MWIIVGTNVNKISIGNYMNEVTSVTYMRYDARYGE